MPDPADPSPPFPSAAERLEAAWRRGPPPELSAFLSAAGELSSAELAEVLCVDQRHRWLRGERVPIEWYLDRRAASIDAGVLVAELVAGELALSEGAAHELETYLKRFPAQSAELELLFALREREPAADPGGDSLRLEIPVDGGDTEDFRTADPCESSTIPVVGALPSAEGATAVGEHTILGVLGRGGMGVVYRAHHTRLKRTVALKMISGSGYGTEEGAARFRGEAEAAARLQHPNIVHLYELGEHEGQAYLSMELVEGGSLLARLGRETLPAAEAAALVATLADAIHHAHERGVIHRDLKPANVLLTPAGAPKISDFGLAKRLDEDSGHTRTGVPMGTPSYMAPEQARGDASRIGPASDVYALGAILYQILTGRPPFRGESAWQTIDQVLTQDPLPPSRIQSKVARDLETIALKCLQKSPERRYASARELADDLRRFLADEPILARRITRTERAWKWARRRPAVAGLLGVSAAAAATIAIVGTAYNLKLQSAFDRAERSLYAAQLARGAMLARLDPAEGLALLDDAERTPAARREFAWRHVRRRCQRERRVLGGHAAEVRAVAGSPDGRYFASADGGGMVRVWTASGGEPALNLLGHSGAVNALAFSVDSRWIAVAGADRLVRLYDVASQAFVHALAGHEGEVYSVAVSADGRYLASGGADGAVLVWEVERNKLVRRLAGHRGSVYSVAFAAEGDTLASGGRDGTIRLWTQADDEGQMLAQEPSGVTALAFAGGGTLAAANEEGAVSLYDVGDRRRVAVNPRHAGPVYALCFSGDPRVLASAGGDGLVILGDGSSGEERTVLRAHERGVLSAASGQGDIDLITGGADHQVRLWSVQSPAVAELGRHERQVTSLAFAADGRRLVSGDYDGGVRLWDVADRREKRRVAGLDSAVAGTAFGREWIAAAEGYGNVRLWDLADGREQRVIAAYRIAAFGLAVSADGRRLATVGDDGGGGLIKLWDAATGRQVACGVAPPNASAVALSADGLVLAGGSYDGVIQVEWLSRRRVRGLSAGASVGCLALTADGTRLAAGRADGAVDVWEWAGGDEPAILRGHADEVLAACFSPDGKTLATASLDGTVRLWDPVAGLELYASPRHDQPCYALVFAPDGTRLALGAADGAITLWEAP